MKNILKTFEPNEKGRDFVIGDLHGSLSVFENLLKNLNFNKAVDRMFSVGDLVDRGPNSLYTLRLLREPWFHAVLANHEQMMLEAFRGGYMGQFWWQNGGTWGREAWNTARALKNHQSGNLLDKPHVADDDMELFDLLAKVEELPFLMTINHKNGKKFHILHAELPPGHKVTDKDLMSPEKVYDLATRQSVDGDAFLWARTAFLCFYRANLSNRENMLHKVKHSGSASMYNDKLSHIISGHTIVQQPITLIGQTNIDTCAYSSYPTLHEKAQNWCALTCINLETWEFCQATETEFRKVEPFVISQKDLT